MSILTGLAQPLMDRKMVLLVFDGLGGLSQGKGTELEVARTPNLDRLAAAGTLGLIHPIARGITPGSGPAHLSLFGYDPLQTVVGRGILSALGVGFSDLREGDVAGRINFCTLGADGAITDRRAGRVATEVSSQLVEKLNRGVSIPGVEVFVRPEKEHRAAVVFRGRGLSGELTDSDPQATGRPPLPVQAMPGAPASAQATAEIVNQFISQALAILKEDRPANGILVRGLDAYQPIPSMGALFKIKPASIAVYPMYRGVAQLCGMTVLDAGQSFSDQLARLAAAWNDFDFFFVHVKKTDSSGEDGNFDAKVKALEECDPLIPEIEKLGPACLAVTGDHSTPCAMKAHSFHPVPLLLCSELARADDCTAFGETQCARGGLGQFESKDLLALMLAHAGRLAKFGA